MRTAPLEPLATTRVAVAVEELIRSLPLAFHDRVFRSSDNGGGPPGIAAPGGRVANKQNIVAKNKTTGAYKRRSSLRRLQRAQAITTDPGDQTWPGTLSSFTAQAATPACSSWSG
jgi:hypothetical protein